MAIASIWKDYFVDLGGEDSVLFRILVGNSVIYSGRATKRPGQSQNLVKINDICADHIASVFPTLGQSVFTPLGFPVEFTIENYIVTAQGEEPDWEWVDSVSFLNDWSYDTSFNPATMGLSCPINGRADARQYLLASVYNKTSLSALLTFKNGTTSQETIVVKSGETGTAVLDLSSWQNLEKVTIDGKTWEIVGDCGEWVLYYVNAFGGWDSFLIEGNASEQDNLTRHNMEREYDNRNTQARGAVNYANEIKKRYTLHTGFLSDDESLRMHHLLNSTEVYLGNLATGAVIPVTLDNTTTEYKTYKSNGARLVNYTIEVTTAQDRTRR